MVQHAGVHQRGLDGAVGAQGRDDREPLLAATERCRFLKSGHLYSRSVFSLSVGENSLPGRRPVGEARTVTESLAASSHSRPDGRGGIDAALVRRLVRSQFPEWAGLPVVPVEADGWDNRTFHLGDDMTVRLPSAAGYAASVEKEQRFLPFLAPHLPLPVPVPLAKGQPGEGYPHHWSINRWLHGETASLDRIDDLSEFATDPGRVPPRAAEGGCQQRSTGRRAQLLPRGFADPLRRGDQALDRRSCRPNPGRPGARGVGGRALHDLVARPGLVPR